MVTEATKAEVTKVEHTRVEATKVEALLPVEATAIRELLPELLLLLQLQSTVQFHNTKRVLQWTLKTPIVFNSTSMHQTRTLANKIVSSSCNASSIKIRVSRGIQ